MKYDTKALEAKMKKTISAYETNLETIRAGQANPAVLNRVTFEYYGAPTPLNTMANVMVTDARTLTIQRSRRWKRRSWHRMSGSRH